MKHNLWLAALALAALLAVPAVAQQTTTHDHDATASSHPGQMTMGKDHQTMMGEDHQRMLADMKAASERIQQLVAKMNAERGDQQVRTMAELLTMMATGQMDMQHHMMDMANCPMAQSPAK